MKRSVVLCLLCCIFSCSPVKLVNQWKDPDIVLFHAYKVLVVGLNANETARQAFEERVVRELAAHEIEAMRSIDLFDVEFSTLEPTEASLDKVEQQLLDKDFDAILFTRVIGVAQHRTSRQQLIAMEGYYDKFRDNLRYGQLRDYDSEWEVTYPVYHVQSSLYCICPDKARQLVWRGVIDVNEQGDLSHIVNEFVDLLLDSMEGQGVLLQKSHSKT